MQTKLARRLWTPRPYLRCDRGALARELAPALDRLYPGGSSWLERKLDEIETGRSGAFVVRHRSTLAGVAIETPKEAGRVKLSTLWVHRAFRRRGIGEALLSQRCEHWRLKETPRVDVTCASSVSQGLTPLFHALGFSLFQIDRNRYGEGRHEYVYSWFPDSSPDCVRAPKTAFAVVATA